MTALTEYPAREEEFGTRAQVLPLLSCALALGTQIVAALRLQTHLRIRKRRAQRRPLRLLVTKARYFASDKEDALPRVRSVLLVRKQSRQGV